MHYNGASIIAVVAIPLIIIIVALVYYCADKKVQPKNSRQFIMKHETAIYHKIKYVNKDKDRVSLEYGGKRYYYKVIGRFARKYSYPSGAGYLTSYETREYWQLEKETDSQPPNYAYMKEMKD